VNRKLSIAFTLIAFLAGCAPASPTPAAPTGTVAGAAPAAYWPTEGWRSAMPEEEGMDSARLADMVDRIQQEKMALNSLLIVRNGYLVTELYAYPYSAGQVHFIASVTKSVMSALVGIAIAQGSIKDVHQTLFSLLPAKGAANLDAQKQAITLEDLLTMTSGLDCHENPAPGEAFMQASPDWVQFMLDLPMAAQPGTTFNYCTAAVELVSAIVQQATGMSAREFANQNLFAPLGIGPVSEAQWTPDPQGVTMGGYGLALTPRDMAKLGYLYLEQGQWDGETVVPADWVATSTASHSNLGNPKEYGYLWWADPEGKWVAALGMAGQHIFVYPAENLVVVFTSDLPTNAPESDYDPLKELLDGYILPAVKAGAPLPANAESVARLDAGIQALAQPQPVAPAPLPAIPREISDKAYTLADNAFGWHTMTFTFQDQADEATVTVDGQQLAIGLDNVYRTPPEVAGSMFPEELRGHWENDDTLVIEDVYPGQMQELTYHVQFSATDVQITCQDKYFLGQFALQGTLNPSTG
jgi:CubicO group peptidase (beta-lactamase class C family)